MTGDDQAGKSALVELTDALGMLGCRHAASPRTARRGELGGRVRRPDNPEDWAFLQQHSPHQNVREDIAYPPLLITTSTRDDRVHPGHARKMVAKMRALGHDVTYYENIEGGHGGAADNFRTTEFNRTNPEPMCGNEHRIVRFGGLAHDCQ